jgi:hypothetical protein
MHMAGHILILFVAMISIIRNTNKKHLSIYFSYYLSKTQFHF